MKNNNNTFIRGAPAKGKILMVAVHLLFHSKPAGHRLLGRWAGLIRSMYFGKRATKLNWVSHRRRHWKWTLIRIRQMPADIQHMTSLRWVICQKDGLDPSCIEHKKVYQEVKYTGLQSHLSCRRPRCDNIRFEIQRCNNYLPGFMNQENQQPAVMSFHYTATGSKKNKRWTAGRKGKTWIRFADAEEEYADRAVGQKFSNIGSEERSKKKLLIHNLKLQRNFQFYAIQTETLSRGNNKIQATAIRFGYYQALENNRDEAAEKKIRPQAIWSVLWCVLFINNAATTRIPAESIYQGNEEQPSTILFWARFFRGSDSIPPEVALLSPQPCIRDYRATIDTYLPVFRKYRTISWESSISERIRTGCHIANSTGTLSQAGIQPMHYRKTIPHFSPGWVAD